MNTKKLQNNFPDIYKEFFAKNDLVLSGCFNFPWGYQGIGNSLGINLKIKTTLPLKCYVGFKFNDECKIYFGNVTFYNIVDNKFDIIEYGKLNKEEDKIIELIKTEFNNFGLFKGFSITILSETTRGHSFGFSGTSAGIISYGIYKIIDCSILNENDFLNLYFNKIFTLSGKIDSILRYRGSFGHNAMFSLYPNKGVSYFLNGEIGKTDSIENIPYKFNKINNDYDLDLPFDYILIFSGLPTDTKQVEYYKKLEMNEEYISGFLKQVFSDEDEKFVLDKYKDNETVKNAKLEIITIETIKLLNYFFDIYNNPNNDDLINKFIDHINTIRFLLSLVEKQSYFASDFKYFFKKYISNSYEEIVGICPAYSGKLGGGYILVTKFGISRNTIEKTIEDLKNIYPNIEIEYCSYLDGTCEDGIKVEQFVSKGIYSKYIDKNKMNYKDNKGNSYLGDYSQLIENQKEGLLLDTINNKIYLNGEKLTSKNIPSQNMTIEIIIKLLENIGVEISNKEFSVSSYSSNKNEMLGKIILPFIKLIEERTNEKLSIVCKGSLTDFFIKMGKINLKIGIIRKI